MRVNDSLDKLHEQVGSDSSLVGEGHALGQNLDDAEDEHVAVCRWLKLAVEDGRSGEKGRSESRLTQLESASPLDVASHINHFPSHRGHEQLGNSLLGVVVTGKNPNELGVLSL